jgi:RNA polymerase sigma-70 factor (ECF subfamily)
MGGQMTEHSDETLMDHVKRGDITMLTELVRKYEKPLFAFIYRIIGNIHEAEEVFQETFLRIHEKRSTYRDECLFRPWMYRISLNLCRDLLRRRPRALQLSLEDEIAPESLADPKAGMTRNLIAYQVKKLITDLPEKPRSVFLLYHYQGMSYQEIASTLQIPLGTVKSRMHEAVKTLSRHLKEMEVIRS